MGFTIRRGKQPADQFAMVPHRYMRDERLAWQTRGLLSWMLGHSQDFEITEEAIVAAGGVQEGFRGGGRDGVRKMIGQLEQVGYLRREREYIPGGGSAVSYVLLDPDDGLTVAPDDGLTVPRRDQAERSVSPVRTDDGLAVPPSLEEEQKKNKTPSVSTAKRGTRVPDDFQPDEKMRAWFKREGIGQFADGRVEHEKFMDFWRAKPGAGGVKLDWPATWRNWMRSAAERSQRSGFVRPVSAPPGNSLIPTNGVVPFPATGATRASTTDQRIMQGLALAAQFREEESK